MIYKRKTNYIANIFIQFLDAEDMFKLSFFKMAMEEIQNTFSIYYKHLKTETYVVEQKIIIFDFLQ